MTTIVLIRHGANDVVGRALTGRLPGVDLNAQGREQAERLAERLATLPIARMYSSPMERARQTAAPLAARLGLEVEIREAFTEVNFGAWQGHTLQQLDGDPEWRRFHQFRSGMRVPGGETLLEVQGRMISALEELREARGEETVAVVSHGDPIRCVVAHYAGIPLDLALRLEIGLVSVCVVQLEPWGPRLLCINQTDGLPPMPEGR